jgi:hypothetical protein
VTAYHVQGPGSTPSTKKTPKKALVSIHCVLGSVALHTREQLTLAVDSHISQKGTLRQEQSANC